MEIKRLGRDDGEVLARLTRKYRSVDVPDESRRQGVGRALVEVFKSVAVAERHSRMWLYTSENNEAAKALYRSTGGGPSPQDDVHSWWRFDE